MNCPQCGTKNPDDFVFCLQCGERLEPSRSEGFVEDAGRPEQFAQTIAEPIPPPSNLLGPVPGARLSVEKGSVDQREYDLDKPAISIGRRVGNDIVVHDSNVSRQHAKVVRQDGGFVLEDCNSANGTLVNDERVEGSRRLRSGDAIRVGDAVFVFEEIHAAESGEGMNTVAMEADWPMTSIGPPIEVEPPAVLAPQPASPAGPLTPPPAIMDQSHTEFAERLEAAEPSPPPEPQKGEPEPAVAATAPPGSTPLSAIQQDVSELTRDLGAFAASVAALVERVERLERQLAEASADLGQLAEAARGPAAEPLRELGGLIGEAEATGGSERLGPLIELLDKLTASPRDIELLLELSQQTATLQDVLRLHSRLVEVGPPARSALERIVGRAQS